ncbi:hypothetical protein H6G18_22125 [Anabaena subtropica FACHB-260]|uniref:Uncharacterized protein n=1 Tax=Anabaena subtropica FACHB-260 TaxID=2692884 RepID=A0ABR8CWJ7_9NOST|nr:hypothetical protein [Anabaena subtropica FACHB-260]
MIAECVVKNANGNSSLQDATRSPIVIDFYYKPLIIYAVLLKSYKLCLKKF